MVRTNGFQKPYNGMQISTWILVPLLPSHYLTFLTPTLPTAISVPLTILYLICTIIATYSGYVTTKTDSIDHLLYRHQHGTNHPKAPNGPTGDETKYCWVCQTDVYVPSMHCKYCDKCVSNFDHHCMWLNTCIGSANYDTFFRTVVFTFTFVSLHVVTLSIYLALYFLENTKVRSLAGSWWGGAGAGLIVVGFNIGFLVFTAFCGFMVLQLLVFHLGLRREKITTYQYIIRDSARKREKMMLSHKIRQRRVQELENAGNVFEAWCLKAGSLVCFERCDPVRSLVLSEIDQVPHNAHGRAEPSSESDDDDDDDSDLNNDIEMKAEVVNEKTTDENDSGNSGDSINQSNQTSDATKAVSTTASELNELNNEVDVEEKSKAPIFLKVDKNVDKTSARADLRKVAQKGSETDTDVDVGSPDERSINESKTSSSEVMDFLP